MPEPLDLILRYAERVAPLEDLRSRLSSGRKLRVKLGLDPTAPAVTLGWAVVLRKLRHFQELGHTAVLIVGDFTAQVGDPSGRNEARPRLSAEEIRGYADSVLTQFERVLLPRDLEVRYNSEWLGELEMADILRLASQVTVAQMLERADFASRFSGGNPISLMEFLYPLLQGYDSVAVEADVELGGADQLWNLMMGRVIQERYGLRPQVALTMPLLVGTDGRQKMSQSLGNYIGVEEPPADMFGRVLSIPDTLMLSWFRLAADYEPRRVEELGVAIQDGSLPAVEAKRLLAREIVTLYWGREAAAEAQEAFDRVFRQRLAPEVVPEYSLPAGDPIFLPALLKSAGLTVSSSDARRLIAQGAVRLDGSAVTGEQVPRSELLNRVIQVGKRRFLRVVGV